MKPNGVYWFILVMGTAAIGCQKPYTPPAVVSSVDLLVVEGIINAGTDSTYIRLSHTVKLSEKIGTKPESGANVTVEGEGTVYHLSELAAGTYAAAGLNLNSAQKYHLKIHTAGGQEYQSDDVEVKITPPIDSLNYKIEADGVHIYSAAHDATNNTRYYRFDYNENWRFNSFYQSDFKVVGDTVLAREFPQDEVYKCYSGYQSSTILLGSSVKLGEDVITQNPITQIKTDDEKISIRYTILLRQYGLTKEAYAFWETLKKNTEQLGSIFDALPSEISGNVHSTTNPATPVIGFVSISTVTSKRLYIDREELPFTPEWQTRYPYEGCAIELVGTRGIRYTDFLINAYLYNIPVYGIGASTGTITGYGYSSKACVVCTIRGSTNKPAFWTDKL